jgi:hypothetical protein
MSRLLLLAVLLGPLLGATEASAAETASGKIYRTTDAQGNVLWTDTPPANAAAAERVELQQTNTAPPPPSRPAVAAPSDNDADAVSHSVSIASPPDETSLPMGPGNFSVTAQVKPSLGPDESLQLYLDDMPWGGPQQAASWDLTNVFRGAHDLTVAVLDGDGQQLTKSEPVRVYVHRPSINFRNR